MGAAPHSKLSVPLVLVIARPHAFHSPSPCLSERFLSLSCRSHVLDVPVFVFLTDELYCVSHQGLRNILLGGSIHVYLLSPMLSLRNILKPMVLLPVYLY